jgi:hypothetical protein
MRLNLGDEYVDKVFSQFSKEKQGEAIVGCYAPN